MRLVEKGTFSKNRTLEILAERAKRENEKENIREAGIGGARAPEKPIPHKAPSAQHRQAQLPEPMERKRSPSKTPQPAKKKPPRRRPFLLTAIHLLFLLIKEGSYPMIETIQRIFVELIKGAKPPKRRVPDKLPEKPPPQDPLIDDPDEIPTDEHPIIP